MINDKICIFSTPFIRKINKYHNNNKIKINILLNFSFRFNNINKFNCYHYNIIFDDNIF